MEPMGRRWDEMDRNGQGSLTPDELARASEDETSTAPGGAGSRSTGPTGMLSRTTGSTSNGAAR